LPRSTLTVRPDSPVFTGETVSLTCVIESDSNWRQRIGLTYYQRSDWRYYQTPEWRYEWYKGRYSVMLQTSKRYIVNRDTLTIRGATESDQGQYWCRGQRYKRPNSSQSSSAVSLNVTDLPTSSLTVTPNSVFAGERVSLKCVIESYSNWRYEWYKDSTKVSERHTGNTFTIERSKSSDEGQYTCRGQRNGRPNSSQSSSVSLSVMDLPRPTLTVTPDSPVFTGERVNLTCVIESDYSNWRYEWYKGTDRVMPHTPERYTVNRDTLSIRGATESDQDQYMCRGQRDERPKSSQSSSVSLTVMDLPRPTLTVTPNSPVFTGETVNLTCVIESYSNWRYEWYKGTDSVMLQTSERYTVNRDTLTIRGATESDQDQYWCRGQRDERPNSSQSSSAVYLTVMALN
ncbi:basement membrane-specific heparan sulfate proteoglycan core protein-like, partial [Sinocyclocheilus grahami]|uniref:basement membrane-specific heparan sulfate proteoglycan core protein-like n=1 Tax=Sinocyclocheilus grahami TaxID=75366 RepID=UPI0007AD3732